MTLEAKWGLEHIEKIGELMAKHGLTVVRLHGLTVERDGGPYAGNLLPVIPPPPTAKEPTDDELLADPYAGLEVPHGS